MDIFRIRQVHGGVLCGLLGLGMLSVAHAESTADPAAAVSTYQEQLPGRMVEVSGRHMHLYCSGAWYGPVVILDAGLGGFALEWVYVQQALATTVRVCSYDRAGYGWSEAGAAPRLSSQLAEELLELLENSGVEPPYVLVGHSFGGYVVRYFTGLVPYQVAGMVLVESSHPEQIERLPDVHIRREHQIPTLYRPVVTRVNQRVMRQLLEKYPEHMHGTVAMLMSSRRALHASRQESAVFALSAAEVTQIPLPQDMPLVVVSRGLQEWESTPLGTAREHSWRKMQAELVNLTRRSRQIIANYSGHQVHLDQPEVVVAAVCRVLAMAGWPLDLENRRAGRVGCVNASGAIAGQHQ